jgi:uncharacterized tellurite resistance protein B-like protein
MPHFFGLGKGKVSAKEEKRIQRIAENHDKEKAYEIVMNGSETDYDTESLGTQSDTILCVPISAA